MQDNQTQPIEDIYEFRKNNIIIGLTGRTGSGCSTVAKILKTDDFNSLDLYSEKCDQNNEENIKRGIIHDFLRANNRWHPFYVIEVSNIILSFVLERGTRGLIDYVNKLVSENKDQQRISINNLRDFTAIINKLSSYFSIANKYKLDQYSEIPFGNFDNVLDFYFNKLSDFKNAFKKGLQNINCNILQRQPEKGIKKTNVDLYSFLMQKFGNNLRANGDCFNNSVGERFNNKIMKRIDSLIELLKQRCVNSNPIKPLRVCIDSLRNPIEIIYLKDRYSCFYQLSINADEYERRNRLSMRDDELLNLDKVEYPQKYEHDQQFFYHQDIQKCIEFSNIHINNKNISNGKYTELTEQLVRYIALMIHPGLVPPTKEENCMQIAYNAKLNSGCLSRQVGAVITSDDWAIKAVGWNDVPAKQVPCNLRSIPDYCKNKNEQLYSEFEINDPRFEEALKVINAKIKDSELNGMPHCYCFKDIYNALDNNKNQVHTRSLHAEENAFLQISKYGGQGIQNGKLFVTASPCELCSKKSYQLGIRHIYYIDPYPGIAMPHILKFKKNSEFNPQIHLFKGVVGDAYVSLYTQRLSIKDELKYITGIDNKQTIIESETPQFQRLKCTDITFNKIRIVFKFISRTQIECTVEHTVTPNIDDIPYLEIMTSWTGNAYDGCSCSGEGVTLEEIYTGNKTAHKCRVKFNNGLKKGKTYIYTIKSEVRDVGMAMLPHIARWIQHITEEMEIVLIYPNGKSFIVENSVKGITYIDKEMSQQLSESPLEYTVSDNNKIYSYNIKNANINYTYSINWEFDDKVN